MTEPWFDPNAWSWIPGTVVGLLGGVVGTLAGVFSPRGKARGLVLGLITLAILFSLGLLIAGVVAKISGQPWGIWYGFMLPGVIGLIAFSTSLKVVRRNYVAVESRRNAETDDWQIL